MTASHRFVLLDGIRGIAALGVVCMHLIHTSTGIPFIFPSSSIAVDIFFCLSGFVIAWNYYQKLQTNLSVTHYLRKRLIRLYPMFLIGTSIGIVALFLKYFSGQTTYSLIQITKATLLNILYLPYLNHGQVTVFDLTLKDNIFPTNNPGWSLFYELIANLLFVFTIKLSKNTLFLITGVMAVLLIWFGLTSLSPPGWKTAYFLGGFPRVGYSFMVGVLIFKFYEQSKSLPTFHPLILMGGLVLMLQLSAGRFYQEYWLLSALIASPLLIWFGTRAVIQNKLLERVLDYLGWLSYPIYCLHIPIWYLASVAVPNPKNYHIFTIILILTVIVLAHLLGKWVDEPARKFLNKKALV